MSLEALRASITGCAHFPESVQAQCLLVTLQLQPRTASHAPPATH